VRIRRLVSRQFVIEGGFIGVEIVENQRHRGVATTLIETAAQVMTPFDPEMAAPQLVG
jgi:pyruvate/2-oxoglutarate dehydrogenase complex dihydrolipoamide dehydrogenase (E3) component